VELSGDLGAEELAAALPGRPVRSYPALLSTHADALAWARSGGPEGALVVADYQASPRGRGGLEWQVRPGLDLSFSLVLRPSLTAEREGWLYTVGVSALADLIGEAAAIEWPDEVHRGGGRVGAVGVHAELGAGGVVEWAVASLLVNDVPAPRAGVLARAVDALEARHRSPTAPVLADYLRRCSTIGRRITARLMPLGPAGPTVTGRAVTALADGALVVETGTGRRVAVRPQNLGRVDDAA
jgi:BirA family transcriptional regulator, biotin operon repressor / biotin---[acetyl-CoA-carboxylase] ligase